VPLVQGYGLAMPGDEWPCLEEATVHRLRDRSAEAHGDSVAPLVEAAPTADSVEAAQAILSRDPGLQQIVIVDHQGRPTTLLLGQEDGQRLASAPMKIKASSGARTVIRRALSRDSFERFDPLVAIDDLGAYAGTVRLERLIEFLLPPAATL
jgi:hypothetical protein